MAAAAAEVAAAVANALPIKEIIDDINGKAFCVEAGGLSKVNLPEKRGGLSWSEAERQMNAFVKKDPANNLADYTGWFGFPAFNYVIRLYKANGVVVFKEYGGTHGVVCDGSAYAHTVNVLK